MGLGQSDERFLALANGEDVGETGSERLALGVTDVDDLVRAGVLLEMHELAHTTNIVTTSNEDEASVFEFNNAIDLASLKVKLPSRKNVLNIIEFQAYKRERAETETLTFTVSFFLMSGWG